VSDLRTLREEFPVLQYAIATARMQGPFKGNGAVGPCAFVEGRSAASLLRSPDNRPGPETAKQTCEIRRQVGLSAGRGVPDDDLLRHKRTIHRYQGDGLDAEHLEFARVIP
jgi:hypothetical protein